MRNRVYLVKACLNGRVEDVGKGIESYLPSGPDIVVSVIVPCFEPDFSSLQQCVDSILNQEHSMISAELILVDNHPEPALEARLESRPGLRILHEPKPGSYAARNRGIRAAQGEVLAFTDSDCRPSPRWLEEGVSFLRNDQGFDGVAGAINISFRDPSAPRSSELYDSLVHLRQEAYVKHEQYGATANLFVWKAAFEQVGLFDDSLMSSGDREWGGRAAQTGHRLGYAAEAIVNHPARRSWTELVAKALRVRGGEMKRKTSSTVSSLAREMWEGGRWRFRVVRKQKARFTLGQLCETYMGIIALQSLCFLESLRLRGGGEPRR